MIARFICWLFGHTIAPLDQAYYADGVRHDFYHCQRCNKVFEETWPMI